MRTLANDININMLWKKNWFPNIPNLTCLTLMSLLVLSVGNDYDYTDYGEYSKDHEPYAWNSMDVRSIQHRQCLPIPDGLTLCRNVGYTNMSLPNLLSHDSVEEVRRQAAPWVPLHNIGCHPNTDLFLCSLYAPVCLDRPIYPCQSLCESVKRSCEGRMNKYGFQWPDILRCDKFPPGDSLCIKELNVSNTTGYDKNTGVAANICPPCKQPITFESILDSYCWANFVIKVKIRKVVNDKNDKKLVTHGKLKFYKPKPNNMNKQQIEALQLVIPDGNNCDCESATRIGGRSLVMGTADGNRFVVTYISDWANEKEFKKALKAIAKGHDCKTQIDEIAGQTDANNGGLPVNVNPLPTVDEPIIIGEDVRDKNKTYKSKNKDRKKNKGTGKVNDNEKGRDKDRGKESNRVKDKVKDNAKGKDGDKGKENGKEIGKGKGHIKGKGNEKSKKDSPKEGDNSNPKANIAGIGCVPCTQQPLVYQNLKDNYCSANFVAKVSVKKVEMDENGDKRLVIRKIKPKDFLKQENLSPRDIRKLQPVISGGSSCDCESAAKRKKLFIMGQKEDIRHVITFLNEDTKDSELKRFQKDIQTGINCSIAATTNKKDMI